MDAEAWLRGLGLERHERVFRDDCDARRARGARPVLLLLLLVAALAAHTPARPRAEPGPVGRWLMTEPASLWELGMSRLQSLLLAGLPGDHPLARLWRNAYYSWDENRIYVTVASDERYGEARCSYFVGELRSLANVRDGKPLNAESSLFANQFARGFSTHDEPEDYTKRLDEIMVLRVDMDGGSCHGRLLSGEVVHPDHPRLSGLAGAEAVAIEAGEPPPAARFAVHVASVRDPADVPGEWRRLAGRYQPLAGLEPQTPRTVEVPGKGTFHRVLGGAFATRAEARAVCGRVRSAGGYCAVVLL